MNLNVFWICLIFACISKNYVSALKCFQCNSLEHPECSSLSEENTTSPYFKECSSEGDTKNYFCRKLHQELKGSEPKVERIRRSCGWMTYKERLTDLCFTADTDFKKDSICQCFKEGCNSASRHFHVIFSLIPLILLFVHFG